MRKSPILAIGALAISAILACSQPLLAAGQAAAAGHAGSHAAARAHRPMGILGLAKQLGLTAQQKADLKPVQADHMAKMKALRQNKTLSKADRRSQMKDINQAFMAKVKQILTPAQMTKLRSLMKAQRGRWQKARTGATK